MVAQERGGSLRSNVLFLLSRKAQQGIVSERLAQLDVDHKILVAKKGKQSPGGNSFRCAVQGLIEEPAKLCLGQFRVLHDLDTPVDLDDKFFEKHLGAVHQKDGKILGIGIAEDGIVDGEAKDIFDYQAAALPVDQVFDRVPKQKGIVLGK